MKKIDYYAVQQPWRMPKWLGATLGGIFGFIVIISGVAIVKLTSSPAMPVAAVGAVPTSAAPATPAPAAAAQPAVAPAAAPADAPAVAAADTTAPAPAGKHHKHHAASHHAAKAVAANKHMKGGGVVLANAKHDKHKIGEKDALDKLLGL